MHVTPTSLVYFNDLEFFCDIRQKLCGRYSSLMVVVLDFVSCDLGSVKCWLG